MDPRCLRIHVTLEHRRFDPYAVVIHIQFCHVCFAINDAKKATAATVKLAAAIKQTNIPGVIPTINKRLASINNNNRNLSRMKH